MEVRSALRFAFVSSALLGWLSLAGCETMKLPDFTSGEQRPSAGKDVPGKATGPEGPVSSGQPLSAPSTLGGPPPADSALIGGVTPIPTGPEVAALPHRGVVIDETPGAVRVGLLLPLSGTHEALGQQLLGAAQMALFDLSDERFVILPFDTKGTAAGAAAAAEAAVGARAKLILGPLLAASVRAAAPIARSAGIPVVAFSNSRDVAGNGVFILGFVPQQQVQTVVDYAVEQGLYRYAALVPNDAYGHAVLEALRAAAAAREASVVRVQYYDPAATDLTAPAKAIADYDRRHRALLEQRLALEARDDEASKQALKRLQKLDTLGDVDFDAVLLPARDQQLKAIASLLSYYDVDQPAVRLLGLSNWGETHGIDTEPSLNYGWYAAPPREERERFLARFRDLFHRPPAAIASLAYDAMALAIILAQRRSDDEFSRSRLIQPHGFLGVDGLFRLRDEGVAERVFEIREVTRNGFKVRRPAPTSFPKTGS